MKPMQLPACDRCTQGVMDATNDHARGICPCSCHVPDYLTSAVARLRHHTRQGLPGKDTTK